MTDFTTIPVTLDTDALERLTLTSESRISVSQADTNVAGIIAAALEPLGLGYEIVDGHLIVTKAVDGELSDATVTYDVADLTGNDPAQLDEIAEMLIAIVAPKSWVRAGGKSTIQESEGRLVVQQNSANQFLIAKILSQLRLARGLAIPELSASRPTSLVPRALRAKEKLNTPISVNYSRPTKLMSILNYLATRHEIRFLIDWKSAAKVGWAPSARTTVTIQNRSLREALAELLTPMDLALRVVDETQFEITTSESLVARQEVEFFNVSTLLSRFPDPQQLIAQIKSTFGEHLFDDTGDGSIIRFDRSSKHLIARLPHIQHADLAAYLASLKRP